MLSPVDVHLGTWKVRNSAGMIAVEMRQQEMPHIAGRITQCLDLLKRRLGRIEPRRRLPDPSAPKPLRRCDVVEAKAGIDKRETIIGLDQKAVANHARPLEQAAGAVHQTPPDRAHGAGVEMMDAHDVPSARERRHACHLHQYR
jgi:hypothetical protein